LSPKTASRASTSSAGIRRGFFLSALVLILGGSFQYRDRAFSDRASRDVCDLDEFLAPQFAHAFELLIDQLDLAGLGGCRQARTR